MRNFVYSTIAFLVFTALSYQQKKNKERSSDKPNVILILTDDQGWGDLSMNGNTQLSTPNIDQIAANGATFENFYVSPVCSPTRAELLTGRFYPRSGVYSTSAGGERIDLDETTIADILKDDGYATGAFGKWHSGMQYPYHPNGRGFDEYYGFASGHWGHYFSPMLEHNGEIVQGEGYLTDDLTNKAIDFIEDNKNQPFFAYLPLNIPHSPMQVPDEYWDSHKDKVLTQRGTIAERENVEHTKAALAMCENVDYNVGRVMAKLDQLNLTENTIVIYLSDNGPNGHRWNGNMKGTKGSTDEGGVRSPLVIQWKNKIAAGLKIKEITSSIDFLPTLSELTKVSAEINHPLDGTSMKSLLLQEKKAWPDRYVYNYWNDNLSIRSQKFRLDSDNQLYDMVSDHGQTHDVSADFPEIKKDMLSAKTFYEEQVITELPEVDNRPFPLGHPDYTNTQVPARDGIAHGNIKRSNRWPNCSFFTNWADINDQITWDVDVVEEGKFEVVLYYTCSPENVGSTISLNLNGDSIQKKITQAHNPPLVGMAEDRGDPRGESYVKDFKPLNMGVIHLDKGPGQLILKAEDIVSDEVIDFRLMMFKRV